MNFLSTHTTNIGKMDKSLHPCQEEHHFGYLMLDTDNKNETPNTNFSTNTFPHRAVEVIFTKILAKKGIARFGERAVAAIVKEDKQLDYGAFSGKPVVQPISQANITKEDRSKALEAVNLIKEKRNGIIKGRTCADGSKQRKYLKVGEDISSPTVSLEAITSTQLIDTYEERDVGIFDVPGAYLHELLPNDKNIIMVLRNEFVDIMCDVNQEYKKYVVHLKNGKIVLYLKFL